MSNTLARDFTEGSIPKQLFKFMIPFMLSNALQVLYSTVDMIIVGNFVGSAGLSAVSQGSQVVNFAVMFFLGFSMGGQILISQVVGAKKHGELNKVIGTLFTLLFFIAIAYTILMVSLREPILKLVNMPEEGFSMAMDYVLICGGGLIFTAGYNVVSSILRGMGDSKRPFIFIAIASIVNLVLDLLFTGYLGWQVAGAAAATIIGQAVSFIFAIFYLYRRKESFYFDFKPSSFKLDKKYAITITKQGIPMAAQTSIVSISMIFVSSMVNTEGLVASATFGVGLKIDDICIKISHGIQAAAAPMIGQNFAAGKFDRAKKVVYWTWLFSGIFVAVFLAYYLPFGDNLFALFSNDAAVIEMSSQFRYAIFWELIFLAIMRGSNGFVQGIGFALFSFILGVCDGFILRIGFCWLFGVIMGMGFTGYVLGFGLAAAGTAIPSCIYFFSGIWKKRKTLVQ